GQLYQWTTNPIVATGDGLALAYRAGARVKDLEFIQFHPTALKDGKSPLFLLSEALRGEGGYLIKLKKQRSKLPHPNPLLIGEGKVRSSIGERFMKKIDPQAELAPRDIVARAIFAEQQKGPPAGGEVYLDIRHKGKEFLQKRFPNIFRKLKRRGLDLSRDLIPVTPVAHYSCGGIQVDLYGRTNIKNLFAFGEVACTGVHGANRLASNSLLESVVFPLRLKECISNPSTSGGSLRNTSPSVSLPSLVKTPGRWPNGLLPGESLSKIRKGLQQLMWEKVGIVRTRKRLLEALDKLREWEREIGKIKNVNKDLIELKNMILVSRLVVQAALSRPKSLGAHFID
ncbi:FAD-binding protein, partial [Candidatus Gottesmanbacteria bacterium]|nr:FAD-binding protein [Candidatus Gottesmanbacteria bacterium]